MIFSWESGTIAKEKTSTMPSTINMAKNKRGSFSKLSKWNEFIVKRGENMKLDIAQWIVNAVGIIASGVANKLEKGDVTVYKCGKIIRIDIKGEIQEETNER